MYILALHIMDEESTFSTTKSVLEWLSNILSWHQTVDFKNGSQLIKQ